MNFVRTKKRGHTVTYQRLTKQELTELREEMRAAGEWAKTVLEQERRQTLAHCESCPSSSNFVRTKKQTRSVDKAYCPQAKHTA